MNDTDTTQGDTSLHDPTRVTHGELTTPARFSVDAARRIDGEPCGYSCEAPADYELAISHEAFGNVVRVNSPVCRECAIQHGMDIDALLARDFPEDNTETTEAANE